MAYVSSALPSFLANVAAIGLSKKIQAWAPFPDRERSIAIGRSNSEHTSLNWEISLCHSPSSKSMAKK